MSDPSDNACIEYLRPNSVPEGLIALGTVVQITENLVKLQITGGIICQVPERNISHQYSIVSAENSNGKPKLNSIFKVTQQYVCKVVAKVPRSGYADALDIIATLDPRALQENNLTKTLLSLKNAAIQCSVNSIEDHGYQMDIGFKNVTGFLSFDAAKEYCKSNFQTTRLQLGQIVRCCIDNKGKEYNPDDRVVPLSIDNFEESPFSNENILNNVVSEQCILPGSQSFLTVMKVAKEGLIVNFMNDYGGFVGKNHLKEIWHAPQEDYKISNEFECTVLYFNPLTKLFCLSIRGHETMQKSISQLNESYHAGKFIKVAKVVCVNGLKSVVFKIDKQWKAVANVKDAIKEDIATLTKDEIHQALDDEFPINSKHTCRIKSINLADQFLVVSTKSDFLELPCVSAYELKAGDLIDTQVKKFVKQGIVVTFGLNLRAIILNEHSQNSSSANPFKGFSSGQPIKCRVLKVETHKQPPRVYLTNKKELLDPNLFIIDGYQKTNKLKQTQAIVTKINRDGIIVEMFNNTKGFIPRRFATKTPVRNMGDILEIGQLVHCTVVRVSAKSLVLGMLPYEDIVEIKKQKKQKKVEDKIVKDDAKLAIKLKREKQKSKKALVKDAIDPFTRIKTAKRKAEDIEESNEWESEDDGVVRIKSSSDKTDISPGNRASKRSKYLPLESGINWGVSYTNNKEKAPVNQSSSAEVSDDDGSSSSSGFDGDQSSKELDSYGAKSQVIKSRKQRSEEARLREEKLRAIENELSDPLRQPTSISDFERLVLKTPNSAEPWIKYSKFFIDNIETEKSRIVCRRALRTINFRLEKEKLKVWLQLIKIEAKFGGKHKLREVLNEAIQTNDKLVLYQGAINVLAKLCELDECDRLFKEMLKDPNRTINVWINYISYLMEHKHNVDEAREALKKAAQNLQKSDLIMLRSRFAQLEFKLGDVERGKTMFEDLLSDNPKRTDIWRVYSSMIVKYGTRQADSAGVKEQNDRILERIRQSIDIVSKKLKKQGGSITAAADDDKEKIPA